MSSLPPGRAPPVRAGLDRPDDELSSEEYLEKHNISFYLNDVISLLLNARDEQPLERISEYFESVLAGTHTLLREYAFVSESARERWAFAQSVREALADLDHTQPISAPDLTQLVRLVCPDFPHEMSVEACRLCGAAGGLHPLGRLLHAMVVRICFADFLRRVADVFHGCDVRRSGRVERSVVGLALRQAALASESSSSPPAEIFDELIGAAGDVRLLEVEALVVHSAHMRNLLASGPEENDTLVSSPPPRDASQRSPGSAYAAASTAAAAAAAGAGAGRRGMARATRDKLAEAAASAAACAAAGEARSGTRRAVSAKPSTTRRTSSGARLGAASRAALLAQPPPTAPPGTPR